MFSITTTSTELSELNEQRLSSSLKSNFEDADMPLTEDAKVQIELAGNKWRIVNGDNVFKVRKQADTLRVYREASEQSYDILGGVTFFL